MPTASEPFTRTSPLTLAYSVYQ